jgi:hypothetical protein
MKTQKNTANDIKPEADSSPSMFDDSCTVIYRTPRAMRPKKASPSASFPFVAAYDFSVSVREY